MRIQHNIITINAYRNYNNNTSAISKNLEKLSSGYKINRAGDDAVGLAVSQKMRLQIAGLAQAQKNAKSGISYVQTAEGALQEVHEMLERMYTLAEQSANGTFDSTTDRTQLQKEVNNLMEEINRIGKTANFNGMGIFKQYAGGGGSLAAVSTVPPVAQVKESPHAAQQGTFTIDLAGAKIASGGPNDAKVTITIGTTTIDSNTVDASSADVEAAAIANLFNGQTYAADGVTFTATVDGTKVVFKTDAAPTANASAPTGNVTIAASGTTDPTLTNPSSLAITGSQDAKKEVTADNADTDSSSGTKGKVEIDFTGKTGADLIGKTMEVGTTKLYFVDAANEDAEDKDGYTTVSLAKDADAATIATTVNGKLGEITDFSHSATTGKVTIEQTNKTAPDGTLPTLPEVKFGGGTENGKINFWIGAEYFDSEGDEQSNKLTINTMSLDVENISILSNYNDVGVDVDSKVSAGNIKSIDITTADNAMKSLNAIKLASDSVSNMRGTLGAMQNRLDHTIKNLSVMQENMQDAESVIRDTDVAEEMMAYTKNNILVQSAQAMLAQANQLPQGVLQLLG